MYGIFPYIYHKNQPNVGKYTIHGSYGYDQKMLWQKIYDTSERKYNDAVHNTVFFGFQHWAKKNTFIHGRVMPTSNQYHTEQHVEIILMIERTRKTCNSPYRVQVRRFWWQDVFQHCPHADSSSPTTPNYVLPVSVWSYTVVDMTGLSNVLVPTTTQYDLLPQDRSTLPPIVLLTTPYY